MSSGNKFYVTGRKFPFQYSVQNVSSLVPSRFLLSLYEYLYFLFPFCASLGHPELRSRIVVEAFVLLMSTTSIKFVTVIMSNSRPNLFFCLHCVFILVLTVPANAHIVGDKTYLVSSFHFKLILPEASHRHTR